MKYIAVVGANGRSGRAFIDAALAAGYHIRAGVHSGTLPPHEHLEIIRCDATNQAEVATLIAGCNAVVSLIGHVPKSPQMVQTEAIKTIIGEMERQKIRQLISLTGTGVRVPGDTPSFIDRVMNLAILTIDPDRIHDGIEHARVVQQSDLDWTIVRVLKLTNGRASAFHLTSHGPAKLFTSRTVVAHCIMQIIADKAYAKTLPVISK